MEEFWKMALSDKWIREVYWGTEKNGERQSSLTFCGALEKCYANIACYWRKGETRKKNEASYENIILPALANHNEKRMGDYIKEDFDEAIETIKKNGYYDKGVIRFYSDSSLKNFERLIYYVVFYASERGLCENVLWGSHFEVEGIKVEDKVYEKVQLKKSLTPIQEKKMVKELLEDVTRPGEEVAVLLMLGLGARNGEASGLNYGDIKGLLEFPEDIVAWIYKTTIPGTNHLQSGGKTWNAGRIVPVPQKVVAYLKKRREMLEEYLETLGILSEVDVDQLPIACKGNMLADNNYKERASSRNVTNAAKTIFKEIGLEGRQLAYIEAELLDNACGEVINEKDPTAYLLRRNFATHLQILGFSISEIQYLIGHDVEDSYESRNEYVDDKRLHEMARRLSKRPLLNEIERNDGSREIVLGKGEHIRVSIKAQEPLDVLKITVIGEQIGETFNGIYYAQSREKKCERNIDVDKVYHKVYR